MRTRVVAALVGTGALLMLGSRILMTQASQSLVAPGEEGVLPGDQGRLFGGILPKDTHPIPPEALHPKVPRAPDLELAIQAARAIAEGCKQYSLGIAVANSAGAPILVYVPNGSDPSHGYIAIRKAYSAVSFKSPTTPMVEKAHGDPAFAARVKADPNLMAFKGGIPLRVQNDIIGAIGVSGAEPGGHDDECGQIGVDKIRDLLK